MSTTFELPPAYRVKGPGAVSGEWRRFVYLALTLAFTDWKLRFFGSVLGYMWSLLRPLLLFAILYVVFSQVVDIGGGVEFYPVLLLLGVVLFTYFGEVTGSGVSSVVDRESLVRKISFPRMVIPLSVALAASFNLLLNLVSVGVFLALAGVPPRWTWLLVPLPLIVLVLFSTAVAMLVSALYVPFRDVKPIWEVIQQALFYATPVIYPIDLLLEKNEWFAHLAMMNPLATLIQETRHFVLGPDTPSAAEAIGGAPMLLIPAGIVVGLAVVGLFVFHKMAPHVAERL